jgi:hypothetical protein
MLPLCCVGTRCGILPLAPDPALRTSAGTPGTANGGTTTRSMARFGAFNKPASGRLARTPSGHGNFGRTMENVKGPGACQASHAWHDLPAGKDVRAAPAFDLPLTCL